MLVKNPCSSTLISVGSCNLLCMLAIYHVIKQIRNKLTQNNLMVVKADKERTIIIINNDLYKQKTMNFINKNQFQTLEKDPTENYHKQIQHTLHKT